MNYAAIKKFDIADGPGVRVTLFVSGCTHHCKECFQPETWDFDYGEPFTEATEQELLKALSNERIQGLTLLGGEPFEPVNQRGLVPFLRKVKTQLPEKDIWCYTGYVLDFSHGENSIPRTEVTDEFLSYLNVLVDGEFILEQKSLALKFRGSANQRLIDVPNTLKSGTIVLWQS